VERFELSAAVALWRGEEVLFMKRSAGSFSGGGWFLPGGHVEAGERPVDAAVREVFEEAGIVLDPAALSAADVMTYPHDGGTAHCIVYNALCPASAEPALNDEHVVARWYTPEAFVARFNDPAFLRERGVPEAAIALALEVARVVRGAARARGARLHAGSESL
jgi:8-oxo-dGTP pyrophosphatase MutT (NUDIX family)